MTPKEVIALHQEMMGALRDPYTWARASASIFLVAVVLVGGFLLLSELTETRGGQWIPYGVLDDSFAARQALHK